MTSHELADWLKVKETYLRAHWKDIVKSNAKANIILEKRGRGAAAEYGVKGWGMKEMTWDRNKLDK